MRRETKQEREAWTALIEARDAQPESKYHSERDGKYQSKYEAQVAQNLDVLYRAGEIGKFQITGFNLRDQRADAVTRAVGNYPFRVRIIDQLTVYCVCQLFNVAWCRKITVLSVNYHL